jgi:hypothetical protein
VFNIETPKKSRQIDEDTAFGNVETWAYPSSASETEMISSIDVRQGCVLTRRQTVLQKPFWLVLLVNPNHELHLL